MVKEYSNKKIQKAGMSLITEDVDSIIYEESMDILSFFRNEHIFSLDKMSNFVYKISKKIDNKVVVGKRLKRVPSIVNKLRRFENMKLNRMQDIAGCRAIVTTERKLRKIEKELLKVGCILLKDYIKEPKEDGYRGVHLLDKSNKYPIEIQLRTKVQHSWATAIEIIDLFEETHLKANIGTSEEELKESLDWLDFFKHISNEFSLLEHSRKAKREYPIEETIRLIEKFNILNKFEAYRESLEELDKHIKKFDVTGYNLIRIDLKKATLNIEYFKKENIDNATKKYLEFEKEATKNKDLIIALVSTESVSNLKKAYPNYFADSKVFIENIEKITKRDNKKKESDKLDFLLKMLFEDKKKSHIYKR